jgi:hypothetical protein
MKMLKTYKRIDYSPKNGNIDEKKMIIIVILKQKSGRKKDRRTCFCFLKSREKNRRVSFIYIYVHICKELDYAKFCFAWVRIC